MLYAVDLSIVAEKTMIVEADSKAEAASIVIAKARKRKYLMEEGDYTVLCGTSQARALKESRK